jgi:hypothetical protein
VSRDILHRLWQEMKYGLGTCRAANIEKVC